MVESIVTNKLLLTINWVRPGFVAQLAPEMSMEKDETHSAVLDENMHTRDGAFFLGAPSNRLGRRYVPSLASGSPLSKLGNLAAS